MSGKLQGSAFISPSKSVAALQLMKREVDQMVLGFFTFASFFHYYFYLAYFVSTGH